MDDPRWEQVDQLYAQAEAAYNTIAPEDTFQKALAKLTYVAILASQANAIWNQILVDSVATLEVNAAR